MVEHYPSDAVKDLQKQINTSAEQAIKGIFQADSREAFVAQQKRLDSLLLRMKGKLALDGDLDKALEDYRFFHHLHRFLRDVTGENSRDMKANLPVWFQQHSQYADWEKKLNQLQDQADGVAFEDYKHALIIELVQQESEQDLANLASLALIQQNSHILADTRLSYLSEVNDRKKLLLDLAWMGAGVLLVVAAAVLGLAFPPLVIPGLVVGVAVLGYGIIDFAKKSSNLNSDIHDIELGKRVPSRNTIDEFQALEKKISGLDDGKFLERLELREKHWSTEKKWLKGLDYVASFSGLALALAGLAFILPGIGVPLAAIIVVAVLAVAVIALTAALWSFKVSREQNKLNDMQQEVNKQITADEKMINEAILVNDNRAGLSSSAKIMNEELAAKKRHQTILAESVPKLLEDENNSETEGDAGGLGELSDEREGNDKPAEEDADDNAGPKTTH